MSREGGLGPASLTSLIFPLRFPPHLEPQGWQKQDLPLFAMFTGPLELVNTSSIGAQLRFMEKDPQTRLELFGSERQTTST